MELRGNTLSNFFDGVVGQNDIVYCYKVSSSFMAVSADAGVGVTTSLNVASLFDRPHNDGIFQSWNRLVYSKRRRTRHIWSGSQQEWAALHV